jgi:SHS2 domain-containing protein
MFNWLNELLVYVDSENLAFSRFDIEVDEKKPQLSAECYGEHIDPMMHETRTVVKAANTTRWR